MIELNLITHTRADVDKEHARKKSRDKQRRRRAANPELTGAKNREYLRKYYLRTQVKARRSACVNKLKKLNFTIQERDALLASQGGLCGICAATVRFEIGHRRDRAVVDHDHATGRVRGVLCSACNLLLGLAADSAARLERAADYLGRVA